MNTEKPNWAHMVKGSSVPRGVFTEEMKQAVSIQIEQNENKNRTRVFSYVLTPLVVVMICFALIPFLNHLPAAKKNTMTSSNVDQTIPLHYEPALDLKVIPETDKGIRHYALQSFPLSSVQIDTAVTINNILKYIGYTKPGDDSTSYFGFLLASQLMTASPQFYEFGYGKMSDIKVQETNAFGLTNLRMDGKCGPERRCVYWLSVDQDEVTAYYQMDASMIYEQDLDNDGVTEAIVQTYAKDIYIYKNIDGQIESVNVQSALKTDNGSTITYSPENQEFRLRSGKETKTYQYKSGEDKLILRK